MCFAGIGVKADLPELALPEITSHTGVQKVDFPPYSKSQLQQIANHVLDNAEAYEEHAIEVAVQEVSLYDHQLQTASGKYLRLGPVCKQNGSEKLCSSVCSQVPGNVSFLVFSL